MPQNARYKCDHCEMMWIKKQDESCIVCGDPLRKIRNIAYGEVVIINFEDKYLMGCIKNDRLVIYRTNTWSRVLASKCHSLEDIIELDECDLKIQFEY